MLILTGTPEAFSALDKAQREGRLAEEVGEEILSLYVFYGATVQGSSTVSNSVDVAAGEGENLVIGPGRKVVPPHFKGMYVPKDAAGSLEFLFHRGDACAGGEETRASYDRLLDYFLTAFSIRDDFQWVNLSAYESDRMLPKELSGTHLGRGLLSQDCVLKQLTASFMHPDSPVGRDYWDAVYAEARRLYGASTRPFRSFQKVWITPAKAVVYEKDHDECDATEALLPLKRGHILAYALENELDVRCEEDILAASHNEWRPGDGRWQGAGQIPGANDFTVDLFKQIVLPAIKREVNEGEHFAECRRIYSAMLLAAWLKRAIKHGLVTNPRIEGIADSGNPQRLSLSITSIAGLVSAPEVGDDAGPPTPAPRMLEHCQPHADAFDIPENVEFFDRYVRLFKNGVFRCARSEAGDAPDERVIRVYFSGAIDFQNLKDVIRRPK